MLILPPKFKQALGNGVRTSLYPLVRIYKGVQIDDDLDSATEVINLSIKETNISGEAYNPLLLNSPSISSKADIINNKYTISSVSLSISNALYNGKIFSDDIPSLLNAVVQVYYAANGLDTLEDCLLVYTGTIRRYSQSAETLNLTLEDLTEQKLKTKIPTTLMDDEDLYTDEQIGKPYPMVYGYVDKSPLVLDKNDSLSIDKPNMEIMGIWHNVSNINFQNTSIVDEHPIITGGWLTKKSFLYTYNDGYLPIMEKIPYQFGSRTYEFEEEKTYEFEENSAKINLNSNNFIYEKYVEDEDDTTNIVGTGQLGIPTRIYRPVKKINFFANNHGVEEDKYAFIDYYLASSCNKFYGYTGLDNYSVSKDVNVASLNDTDINNTDTPADDLYYEDWNTENPDATYTWWKTTELNLESGADVVDGVFDNVDGIWRDLYGEDNAYFPVERIQNNSPQSGLHFNSQNRNEQKTGAYARLELVEDIPSYPCVTKILYNIDYFTPSNLDDYNFPVYWFLAAEPSAFWIERNLINRKRNPNYTFEHMITTLNDWHEYYDEENWTTACEVPNHEHVPFDTDDATEFRYTTQGNYGGDDYDNIILGFNTTGAYNSIQWGVPSLRGDNRRVSSCIANLKEFYTLQDVLVVEYAKEDFFGAIRGRIVENEIVTKPHTILQDILKEELAYEKDIVMPDEQIDDNWINSFTLNEQQESKSIIENLFKSSIYIPSFDSAGNFKFIDLKQNIEDYNQFEAIDNQDILKYSFGLTKLEDVKNQVNIKYKKDYGSGDYLEETTYGIEDNNGNFVETLDALTLQLNIDDMVYDIGYYGMKDVDAQLEVESEYIRDKDTARKLQRRLLMWYANQHLTMKLDLPASYMHLESGDYIRFDELIGGKLAFGFDYTQEFVKNGQLIYPVFFVTKVSKSLTKVSLELVQVHRGNFGINDGQLGNYLIPNPYDNYIYEDIQDEGEEELYFTFNWYLNNNDLETGVISAVTDTNLETGIEYEVLLTGSSATFTYNGLTIEEGVNQEIDATDLVNSSILETDSEYGDNVQLTPKMFSNNIETDEEHLFLEFELKINSDSYNYSMTKHFMQYISSVEYELGDVNQDGIINIQDIVIVVQLSLSGEYNPNADLNEDGGINILDIVQIINIILG
jgi:hypothetical protein